MTTSTPQKQQFPIKGMHCAACSSRIENVVGGMEGVQSVSVNLATETMGLAWDPAVVSVEDIAGRVKELGFELVVEEVKELLAG